MDFFPFFIFLQLFLLQFLLCKILANDEDDDIYFDVQIITNELAEQPQLFPNGSGRFKLALAKVYVDDDDDDNDDNELFEYHSEATEEEGAQTDSEDSVRLIMPESWINEMVGSLKGMWRRMATIHKNNSFIVTVSTADGRKTDIHFKMTELTSNCYFIILEDASLGKIKAQIFHDALKVTTTFLDSHKNPLPPAENFKFDKYLSKEKLEQLMIKQYFTTDQLKLIKQKIPETLHYSAFRDLINHPFRYPQINIWRRKNKYKIDVHERKQIQQIEQRQTISLPSSQINLPMLPPPPLPSNNSSPFKNSATKRVSITKKVTWAPLPKRTIDLGTPPMSPINIEEQNMTMNLDDPFNIHNDKFMSYYLAKGKQPIKNFESAGGKWKIGINEGGEKFVEMDKIIVPKKRKIAQIYENSKKLEEINPRKTGIFDIKWAKQQKRGSNWEKNEKGNSRMGGAKVKPRKPGQFFDVDSEDEEEKELELKKFANSLRQIHQDQMRKNMEKAETEMIMIPHPSFPSMPEKLAPLPKPTIDLDLDTPPKSPKNIEKENMTTNLDVTMNKINLDTSPRAENRPINLDDNVKIDNDKALLLDKGKQPMKYFYARKPKTVENRPIKLDDITMKNDNKQPIKYVYARKSKITSPISQTAENRPINLDDTVKIDKDKARRLFLDKGKQPMNVYARKSKKLLHRNDKRKHI